MAVAAAMGRAGVRRFSRLAATAAVLAAVVPSLDALSVVAGPRAYLLCHRTFSGSILGGVVVAALVASGLWWLGRKWEPEPARFWGLLAAAILGSASHLLLDLGDNYGEQLLWPFRSKWYEGNLWPQLDPWLLLMLALVLGVPWLLSVVGEEMGAPKRRGISLSGVVALVLVAGYCGWRARLHGQAVAELSTTTYHGADPVAVEAFPESISPFDWRGVIDTTNSIDVVSMRVGFHPHFEPDMALTHFKPENTPALKAAEKAPGLPAWRNFARFPNAEVTRTDRGGHEVVFRDLRYGDLGGLWLDPTVTVDLDSRNQVTKVAWRFGVRR